MSKRYITDLILIHSNRKKYFVIFLSNKELDGFNA